MGAARKRIRPATVAGRTRFQWNGLHPPPRPPHLLPLIYDLLVLIHGSEFTDQRLADKAGVSRNTFHNLRRGHQPAFGIFCVLANALGYDVTLVPKPTASPVATESTDGYGPLPYS